MYSPLYAKPTSKKTRLLRQHIEEVVSHHKVLHRIILKKKWKSLDIRNKMVEVERKLRII